MQPEIIYTLLFIAPLIGGVLGFILKHKAESFVKLFLSFSGAFLFSLIAIHLLPEVFAQTKNAGVYIVIGFFIQIILEQLSHGVEHGHFHMHHHSHNYVFSLIIGLSLHSLFDGIPLSNQMLSHTNESIIYGVSLHKIPEGFALVTVLLYSGFKRNSSIIFLFLFCCIAPLAVFSLNSFTLNSDTFHILVAVAVGSFLHVSTTILFESEKGTHKFSFQKIISILAGVGLSLLSL